MFVKVEEGGYEWEEVEEEEEEDEEDEAGVESSIRLSLRPFLGAGGLDGTHTAKALRKR
jgi:hypothetical protein